MFHKVKGVAALPEHKLSVEFAEGVTKIYDAAPLMERIPVFKELEDEALFGSVQVDAGGYGIVWNDDIDLSCDELWDNGEEVSTPFDDLMSFADATELWGLSESTLRKAPALTRGSTASSGSLPETPWRGSTAIGWEPDGSGRVSQEHGPKIA